MAATQLIESNPKIGLYTRRATQGPELNLVNSFIEHTRNAYKSKNKKLAIFTEPLLDTGFPDVVVAEYDPKSFDRWTEPRLNLLSGDLKVLHYLYAKRSASAATIETQLGIGSKALLRTLERLLDAGLISRQSKRWKPSNIKETFAIKKLVAVEAKMQNWNSAFQQAQSNKWFASESYVLSPVARPSSKTVARSEQLGIGIFSYNNDSVREVAKSDRIPLPACYASWLFNEWIGHHLQLVGEGEARASNTAADSASGDIWLKQHNTN